MMNSIRQFESIFELVPWDIQFADFSQILDGLSQDIVWDLIIIHLKFFQVYTLTHCLDVLQIIVG